MLQELVGKQIYKHHSSHETPIIEKLRVQNDDCFDNHPKFDERYDIIDFQYSLRIIYMNMTFIHSGGLAIEPLRESMRKLSYGEEFNSLICK